MDNRPYLSQVKRPSRYLGREVNAVYKDPRAMALRVALVFPDLYEVAMSHLGLGLLYDLLNQQEDLWAERVYAPAPDLEALLRSQGQPLTSLESGTPLKDFHLLGVSLQYELGYTNLLNILDLGGVPLLAAERSPEDPVVLGGGPLAFNPEPVAPFFDALVLGDGEEVVLEVAAVVKSWRAARGSREELWQALEEVPGVYVPACFDPAFDGEGYLREIIPRGRRATIVKRVLADLNRVSFTPRPLVPYCQIIHDRLNVEISRGCTRGCRYCQAGMLYRPVRERTPEALVNWVAAALAATGYEEISLLTLSPGDYQALPWLLDRLMERLEPERVALSLPSLRADTLTPEMVSQIQRVRRTGLTMAPEAGTNRLRTLINKNLPEEVILASTAKAFSAGWRLLKLYFMIGLPTESPEDLEAISTLTRQILDTAPRGSRPRLNVSLSTFIPKPHTPFQWEGQTGLEESRQRLHAVKNRLKHPALKVKWNSVAQSWLEGVFCRGDRRLAPVLLAAYRRGCRLEAWSEHLRLESWHQAFKDAGVDPEFYLRPRDPGEPLPWQHLDSGVSRDFLLQERERAYQGVSTPDCRTAGCQDCGVCDQEKIALRLSQAPAASPPRPAGPVAQAWQPIWYRLSFAKMEEGRWLSHLEMIAAMYRSLRRSGLPLAFTGGYHPLPRVAFHLALPVGVESLAETLDLELAAEIGAAALIQNLNLVLPPGLKILHAQRLPRHLPPPRLSAAIYQVESPEPVFDLQAAARFLAQKDYPVKRRRPGKDRTIDLRSLVAHLEVLDPYQLQLEIRVREKDNLKITEALNAIFNLNETQTLNLQILKMRSVGEELQGGPGEHRSPSLPANTPPNPL